MSAAAKIDALEQRVAELEAERGTVATPERAAALVREAFGTPGAPPPKSDWTAEPEAPSEATTEAEPDALRLARMRRLHVEPLEREAERLTGAVAAERAEQERSNFEGAAWPLEQLEQKLEAAKVQLARVKRLDLVAMSARIAELTTVDDPQVLADRIGATVEKAVHATMLRLQVFAEMQGHRARLHSDLCELADLRAQLAGLEKAKDYSGIAHRVGYAFDLSKPVEAALDAQLPSEPGHTTVGQALRAKRAFALGENNIL
ncbi:MAG: hypothetical protein ABI548_02795 [Polyangiaceae bacterium]